MSKINLVVRSKKYMNKEIVFIIAPMLGMVGQATVAYHLQNALSQKYYPIILGYCSPKIQKTRFKGTVIELPWGSDTKVIRILYYPFRLIYLAYFSLLLKPKIIIGQGDTGLLLAVFIKMILKNCRCIGSFHESLVKFDRTDTKSQFKNMLLELLDGIHFVSIGIKEQYLKIYNIKNPIVIYTPF
jgi:hypothetical protein